MKEKTKSNLKKAGAVGLSVASLHPGVRGARVAVAGAKAVKKGAGNKIRVKELTKHAKMLKQVGNARASSIGNTAANKFGKAADTALRLAKKYK